VRHESISVRVADDRLIHARLPHTGSLAAALDLRDFSYVEYPSSVTSKQVTGTLGGLVTLDAES
jgi:hypothetical protein